MTPFFREKEKTPPRKELSKGEWLFCIMSAAVLFLTFRNADVAIESMSRGMKLCVSVVIPSLFPFMVLSELFVRSGAADLIAKLFGGLFKAVFGVRKEGTVALVLGAVCGFPIGTRCALSLYDQGKIDENELEHILTFCNGPSSAFLINGVGTSLFGSHGFGVMLYATQILSSVIVGVCGRGYFYGRAKGYTLTPVKKKEKKEEKEEKDKREAKEERRSLMGSIAESVTSSADNIIKVCAFVVFFSAVTGILTLYTGNLGTGAEALIIGFFEMTGGMSATVTMNLHFACLWVAAIAGWSGLSVHFQFISLCGDRPVRTAPYFFAKLCTAVLNTALVEAGLRLYGEKLEFAPPAVSSLLQLPQLTLTRLICTFGVALIGVIKVKKTNKKAQP